MIRKIQCILASVSFCLLISCDGGILGSGNGGGSPAPLPSGSDLFQFSAALLSGKASDAYSPVRPGVEWFDISRPYETVQNGIAQIGQHTVPIVLASLYHQYVLNPVYEYCANQLASRSPCQSTADTDLSVEYSAEIAEQEIEYRTRFEIREDMTNVEKARLLSSIEYEANGKIGSIIRIEDFFIDIPSLTQDFAFALGNPVENIDNVHYALSFGAPTEFSTSLAVSQQTGDVYMSLQLQGRYDTPEREGDPIEVLVTMQFQDIFSSYEVQYQTLTIDNDERSFVRSTVSRTLQNRDQVVDSLGQISGLNGYLRSQTTVSIDNPNTDILFRESYLQNVLNGRSTCDPNIADDQCELDQDWAVSFGVDPALTGLYLGNAELEDLARSLELFP